jgi:hypothetical protein
MAVNERWTVVRIKAFPGDGGATLILLVGHGIDDGTIVRQEGEIIGKLGGIKCGGSGARKGRS